jgi:2-polyprenyl-3-methyl-5-hydroxy-6-metoxy-1,4-benzoquinol methylase
MRHKKEEYKGRDIDTECMDFNELSTHPHKDYLGHIFRWGFANKFIDKTKSVLDVGCGKSLSLMKTMGGVNRNIPKEYVGVDVVDLNDEDKPKWAKIMGGVDFSLSDCNLGYEKFDVIVCFEVFEHMSDIKGKNLLINIFKHLKEDGTLLISAPVYCSSYKMAKFHINELTKKEFEDYLKDSNFKIVNQYGVFSNVNDIKKVATKEELELYKKLSEFYGNDILGAFLAPKYPEASRNIIHICKKSGNDFAFKESVVKN